MNFLTASSASLNSIILSIAKILRTIVNAPWYVRNEDIRKNLKIPTVKEKIATYAKKYKKRLVTRRNQLVAETNKTIIEGRLKKHPADLTIEIQ